MALALRAFGAAGAGETKAVLEMPAREAAFRIERCLARDGFEAPVRFREGGDIAIELESGERRERVLVQPRSPLFSEVEWSAQEKTAVSVERCVREAAVSGWAAGQDDFAPLPPAVEAAGAFAVCLRARSGEREIRFSGLLVGGGRVVSTAHDLLGVEEVAARFLDGREARGRIAARDEARDLSLIVLSEPAEGLCLAEDARDLPAQGSPVFAFGCADGTLRARRGSGRLVPRTSGGVPLWEVNLEAAPGSSGGPAFDAQGNLLGLVKGRFRGTRDRGYLVPAAAVVGFLKERAGAAASGGRGAPKTGKRRAR